MSGVSIVTSIAGAVLLILVHSSFDYYKEEECEHHWEEYCKIIDAFRNCNIVVMIAVIFNIPVASAAIHYVKKLQSSPNISTFTTLNTEQGVVVNNQTQPTNIKSKMKYLLCLHVLLGLIAVIMKVVNWSGPVEPIFSEDLPLYGSIASTLPIILAATIGARQLKYNGKMKIYAIMSGVSIVTSVGGALCFLAIDHSLGYYKRKCEEGKFSEYMNCELIDTAARLNIVAMIAVIFNIPISCAAI